MPLDQDDLLRWASIGLFSILVPLGVYVGRMNVRASRREIVRDLERLFQFATVDGRPLILPSFELVKYKYDPDSNPDRSGDQDPDANSFRFYVFPVAMYVVLTFLCFEFAFRGTVSHVSHFSAPEGTVAGSITYAFISSYVWSIQYLIRRIANFDLSPISFFHAFLHIMLAIFVTAAIWHSGIFSYLGDKAQVGIAFIIGFFPDLFISALIAKFPWIRLRRVSAASGAAGGVAAGHDPRHRSLHEAAPRGIRDRGRSEPRHHQSDPDLRRDALRPLRGDRLGRAGAAHSRRSARRER